MFLTSIINYNLYLQKKNKILTQQEYKLNIVLSHYFICLMLLILNLINYQNICIKIELKKIINNIIKKNII